MTKTIELGDRVKDRITGLSGIATARSEYMNGCRRFAVQPEKLGKDGKALEDLWFDETSLVMVRKGVHAAIPIPRPEQARPYHGGPARSGDQRSR